MLQVQITGLQRPRKKNPLCFHQLTHAKALLFRITCGPLRQRKNLQKLQQVAQGLDRGFDKYDSACSTSLPGLLAPSEETPMVQRLLGWVSKRNKDLKEFQSSTSFVFKEFLVFLPSSCIFQALGERLDLPSS